MPSEAGRDARAAVRVSVRGVVQGVGFRPYVYSLARRWGVAGWVRNTSHGVELVAEGDSAAVTGFVAALPEEAPPRSRVMSVEAVAVEPEGADGFVILASAASSGASQLVSPDLATCEACRRELLDPSNRRYEYPFINCTDCGPRFTIIEDVPYDRERTTMRSFPLCPACRREYEDPADRRFHAEPNACPVCGPRLRLLRRRRDEDGVATGAHSALFADAVPFGDGVVSLAEGTPEDPAAPIRRAAELLRTGEILAVKGLGGFHLACDATDGAAVLRLRRRKRRPHKPLAVMVGDLVELRRYCRVSAAEADLLTSPEHPIVLLDRLPGPAPPERIADEVAPNQHTLGAMLPYTPLHILLLRAVARPLVMTSGNLAEEPIVADWAESERLADIADAYLVHDRGIAARCDDSVAIVQGQRPRLLRRARGYAPLPVPLPRPLPASLGCGAELKNTFCLTRGADAFLSQHIGDLENLETLQHYETMIGWYRRLFQVSPEVVGYDLHPEYLSTKYALGLPQEVKVAVQHHHAHVAARLVEHGIEGPVIGVSMDGLGYGHDSRLWGGEILVCDLVGYRRVAHLQELPLAGGAAAIRAPWRTAAGWAYALLGEEGLARVTALLRRLGNGSVSVGDEDVAVLRRQIDAGLNAPLTTSCGRLFDAVSAIAGVRPVVTYEGQAAIELEAVAAGYERQAAPYPLSLEGDAGAAACGPRREAAAWVGAAEGEERSALRNNRPRPLVAGLASLIDGALGDLEAGVDVAAVAARLHATVAAFVLEGCRQIRGATGLTTVALVGGVFQNRLLSELCASGLRAGGFDVLTAGLVPGNDGGVALGQAAVAGYTVLQRRGLIEPPDPQE